MRESGDYFTKESSSSGDELRSDINENKNNYNPIEDNTKLHLNSEYETTKNNLIFQDIKNPPLNNASNSGSALKRNSNKLNKEVFRSRSSKSLNKTSTKRESTKHHCRSPVQSLVAGTSYQKNTRVSHFSNKNISSDFQSSIDNFSINDESNLFLYIDFHGHASKKGVFMYGNHLPNPYEAVECMLLPRLMSMNSQHFHFDACNFSEHNMYLK